VISVNGLFASSFVERTTQDFAIQQMITL